MQNRQSLRQLCLISITIIILVSNHCAFAIETLPEITVTASRKLLEEQISNPQLLDEEDIAIAHYAYNLTMYSCVLFRSVPHALPVKSGSALYIVINLEGTALMHHQLDGSD
jgi:hypothetical protein